MSIPVLVQVYDEVRRLAIAGSSVASGDFRLKKLIPPLEASGAKAPVFAKVAQAAQAVVDSTEKTASNALLELTTLVNAILYTQGETGIAGDFKPLESTDLGQQATQASARTLKPLLEALSSTGSGRMELIKDAHERGAFKDLRLVKAAIAAIDDPYPEIGTFIAERVLPLYGKAILPELRATFDVKAKNMGQLNRLKLMHRLDPQGTRELVQAALSDGSKEMKVAAIECLGTADEDIAYLLDQSKAKAKDVRVAAIRALTTARSTTEVVAALKKAIDGFDLDMLIDKVKSTSLPEIRQYVLEQAKKAADELPAVRDKKQQGPAVIRLQHLISCLDGRTDAEAEAFLLDCFEKAATFAAIKSEPSGTDLNELVAEVLSRGTPKQQKALVSAHKTLTGGMLSPGIYAARAIMKPADFYSEFSPYLEGHAQKRTKKNSVEVDRADALLEVLNASGERYFYRRWMRHVQYYDRMHDVKLTELDPRWLDAAVNAGAVDLVCDLARPGHAATNKFLSEQLKKLKKLYERTDIMQTMVRIGHPEAVDAIIDALKAEAKTTAYYHVGYWMGRMITDLPKSALPRFEELLPTLPDKMVDQLMESVLALKNKPDEATTNG